MKKFKYLLMALSFATLSACGGGGSEGSDTTAPATALTWDQGNWNNNWN